MIQHASIETFEGGVAPAVDPADLAPGVASEALDTDPRGLGRLRGRPADIVRLVGTRADVLHYARRLGGLVLIDNDAKQVRVLADGASEPEALLSGFEGRVLPAPFEMPSGALVFAVRGGDPLYVGPVRAQLGVEALPLAAVQEAVHRPRVGNHPDPDVGTITPVGAGPTFEGGYVYFYRASVLFDGFQETPLVGEHRRRVLASGTSVSAFDVELRLSQPELLARRATHVNLYRAQGALTESGGWSPVPESAYRLVASIPLDPEAAADTEGVQDNWHQLFGGTWLLRFRDEGFEGPAFEENAGFPETLEDHRIAVTAAAQGGPFFFKVGRAEADDAEGTYLYRSLPGQPDVTSWPRDYLALPESPVAMALHDGVLYAASRRALYAVDAATLALVRSWPGVGAAGPEALAVGPHGVFVAGDDTLWLVTAAGPQRVGLPVERGTGSWAETAGDARSAYDGASGLYVAVRQMAAGPQRAFLFDAEGPHGTGRFWRATVPLTDVLGLGQAPSGRVLASGVTGGGAFQLVELMASGARRPWSWTSHRVAFPVESLDFKPYHLKVAVSAPSSDGTAGAVLPDLAVSLDGGAFESLPYDGAAARPLPAGGPSLEGRASVPRDGAGRRPRTSRLQLRVEGASGSEVTSITLVHRPMPPR